MKVGDLVEPAGGIGELRLALGFVSAYKAGVVVGVENEESYWPLITVEWNNGHRRVMRREDIKHYKGSG